MKIKKKNQMDSSPKKEKKKKRPSPIRSISVWQLNHLIWMLAILSTVRYLRKGEPPDLSD